jgi:hypothetical protein
MGSLTDNPDAVAAAIKAYREGATKYTLMDVHQKPGEGNYDRVEELQICDAFRAAEAVQRAAVPRIKFILFVEQDTLVMRPIDEDKEGG